MTATLLEIQIQDDCEQVTINLSQRGFRLVIKEPQIDISDVGQHVSVPLTCEKSLMPHLVSSAVCAAFLLSARREDIHRTSTISSPVTAQHMMDDITLVVERFESQRASDGVVYRVSARIDFENPPDCAGKTGEVLVDGPFAPTEMLAVLRLRDDLARKVMECAREPEKATDVGGMRSPIVSSLGAIAEPPSERLSYTALKVLVQRLNWAQRVVERLKDVARNVVRTVKS